jgi:hypothetical protein
MYFYLNKYSIDLFCTCFFDIKNIWLMLLNLLIYVLSKFISYSDCQFPISCMWLNVLNNIILHQCRVVVINK